jgi:hypothetical protein
LRNAENRNLWVGFGNYPVAKLSIAIEEIRQAIQKGETIAVDCEGVDLSRFGSVTLINIAVSGQVYLILIRFITSRS